MINNKFLTYGIWMYIWFLVTFAGKIGSVGILIIAIFLSFKMLTHWAPVFVYRPKMEK